MYIFSRLYLCSPGIFCTRYPSLLAVQRHCSQCFLVTSTHNHPTMRVCFKFEDHKSGSENKVHSSNIYQNCVHINAAVQQRVIFVPCCYSLQCMNLTIQNLDIINSLAIVVSENYCYRLHNIVDWCGMQYNRLLQYYDTG